MSRTSSADGGTPAHASLDSEAGLDLAAEMQVLCVDDEPEVNDLTAQYLEREHEQISATTVASAAEGLDVLSTEEISCVVSDYQMPGTDGIEFLREVRARHADLPFILYTGKGSEEVASEAIAAEVTDYLQKETGTEQYEILANKIERAVISHRARGELADREERFRKLVEGSTDMIVVLDPEGTFEYVSPSVERLMGYEPADLVDTNAFDYMHPDDQEQIWELFQTAVEDPTFTPTEEFRYEHANGEWRWLEAHGRNLLDDPSIGGFVVNVRDISEHKQIQQRYRTLFEQSPAAATVVDDDGVISYVSSSMTALSGYEESELVGESALEFIHPDDHDHLAAEFDAMFEKDEPHSFEVRFVRKDGAVRWARATGRDLREDPNVNGFVVNVLDVTERKERERELRDEQAFVQSVLDTIQDIVYVFDTEGTPLRWNDTANEVLGYSDDELAEMQALDFVHEADREAISAGIEEVLEEGTSRNEARLVTKDGDAIPYEFHGGRLTGPDGEVRGFCGIGRDMTPIVERERDLQRFKQVVDTIPDGVIILDADGRFAYANQAVVDRSGLARDEIIGAEAPQFLSPDQYDRLESVIEDIAEGDREAATIETEVMAADGETFPVEARVSVLPSDGGYGGLVAVAREISDRRERE